MSKRLFCVRQGGRLIEATDGSKYWDNKVEAKAVRNSLQGDLPEDANKDDHNTWKYRVALGPDHRRDNLQ